jgi:transcription elongation factor Elf1
MAADVTINVLICETCGEHFALGVGTGKTNPAKLSDPFPAQCPHCGSQSTYLKKSIQILAAKGEGEPL